MFGLDSLNPISMLATAAFGPLGGIVAQLAQQVIGQFGQQLIGQLGQQIGAPQSAIDDATNSFFDQIGGFQGGQSNSLDDAIAQFGEANGATPTEIGQAQSDFQDAIQDILRDLSEGDDVKDAKSSGGKAAGWLMAMARELGGKMDSMAKDLSRLSKEADGTNPGASTEFTAMSQQFGILSNAASTGLKAIGEAMSNMARKQ
ncbi:hypothetical protein [Sphingobium sp. WCS2017Hpa-17]|uniref:hypothetical protein n=1 Tax=Sphingobium sp. WCS2017Hpa-17 TaxID=3073638 RepID=UPI00288A6A89|nr:hypothetical protein [Sphingobium sp. WCS2017Hpa-17]